MRTIEFKLYPTKAQAETLSGWMRTCCWVYNQALEHRIKAYKRREESPSFYSQCAMLTQWRKRILSLRECPLRFLRDALRRVDRGMEAFFRRCKAGEKPGFPRFRSHNRYDSMEALEQFSYVQGNRCRIPLLGFVRVRGHERAGDGSQSLLRIIYRAGGWFGQVLVDVQQRPALTAAEPSIGIDIGLNVFATLSNGEKIDNPRWLRKSERKLRSAHRRVSRRIKGSRNRRKAIRRLARAHERITAQRRDFCHQHSRKIVNRFRLIGVEDLNVSGMARGHFAKSILDAGWSIFTSQLAYKAANAGRQFVKVDARGTSQTCPACGRVQAKKLSEREHRCDCGCVMDRDHAAAQIILARALGVAGAITPVEEVTATQNICAAQAAPMKQEDVSHYPER